MEHTGQKTPMKSPGIFPAPENHSHDCMVRGLGQFIWLRTVRVYALALAVMSPAVYVNRHKYTDWSHRLGQSESQAGRVQTHRPGRIWTPIFKEF